MVVDLTKPVINIETDENFIDENGETITVDGVLRLAIKHEEEASQKEKAYELLKRIVNVEDPTKFVLKSEEITYLKNLINDVFVVSIAGWMSDYLEGLT